VLPEADRQRRQEQKESMRPERVLRSISIDADRNAHGRAEPYAAESAAHLHDVGRTDSWSVGGQAANVI
jgi:hypothetical protein